MYVYMYTYTIYIYICIYTYIYMYIALLKRMYAEQRAYVHVGARSRSFSIESATCCRPGRVLRMVVAAPCGMRSSPTPTPLRARQRPLRPKQKVGDAHLATCSIGKRRVRLGLLRQFGATTGLQPRRIAAADLLVASFVGRSTNEEVLRM